MWIVESEETADDLIGSAVIIDGIVTGMDRLRDDWIGKALGSLIRLGRIFRDELHYFSSPKRERFTLFVRVLMSVVHTSDSGHCRARLVVEDRFRDSERDPKAL